MVPVVDRDKCTGCCKCIDFCPEKAIILKDGKAFITMACVPYGGCIDECPEGAIYFEEDLRLSGSPA